MDESLELSGVEASFYTSTPKKSDTSTPKKSGSTAPTLYSPIHNASDVLNTNSDITPIDLSIQEKGSDKKFKCEICNYMSNYKHNLTRHLKVHMDGSKPPKVDSVCKRKVTSVKKCNQCNYTSKYIFNIKRHMKVHKTELRESHNHLCDVCGKTFKSKYALRLHGDSIHRKKFKFHCPTCNKGFNQLYHFKGHLSSHHDILRNRCGLCQASFSFPMSLKEHMESFHHDVKYKCQECDVEFTSNRALKDHNRAIHDVKKLTCNLCSANYKWRSSLKYHKDTCH